MRVLLLVGCVLSVFTQVFTPQAFCQEWKAGVAKVDITPLQPMPMAGYASRGESPAEGKLTELWAKVLVLQDGRGHQAAIITLDLVGIGRGLSSAICEEIQKEQNWKRDQIVLCCSHTHTGPVVKSCLDTMHLFQFSPDHQKLVADYAEFLKKSIVEGTRKAVAELKPATLSSGNGMTDFAVNRRNNREPDVPQLREEGKLVGPVDHSVPVLCVRQGDKMVAALFGYACHNTTLSLNEWSGDYAGYAQLDLEKKFPGCQAMYWAGCGADQNPLPRRTVELAQKYGSMLADAVSETLQGELTPVPAVLKTDYREIPLPLDELPTKEAIEANLSSTNIYEVARATQLLKQLNQGEPLSQTYPYPVEVWELGEKINWVFLGGEVVVDYSLRIKEELAAEKPDRQVWCAGYCNDIMAYIPSRRVLMEGGYEGKSAMVYYGLPTSWAPEAEDLIVSTVHHLVKNPSSPLKLDSK